MYSIILTSFPADIELLKNCLSLEKNSMKKPAGILVSVSKALYEEFSKLRLP